MQKTTSTTSSSTMSISSSPSGTPPGKKSSTACDHSPTTTPTPSCSASAYGTSAPTFPLCPTRLTEDAQVDSRQSLENVESKWVGEIAENCQGVKLVLVALKCDLRENEEGEGVEEDALHNKEKYIEYQEGLDVAKRIQALRYLGMLPPKGGR